MTARMEKTRTPKHGTTQRVESLLVDSDRDSGDFWQPGPGLGHKGRIDLRSSSAPDSQLGEFPPLLLYHGTQGALQSGFGYPIFLG